MGTPTYDKTNTKQIKMKFNLRTDADILTQLKHQKNVQGYIKQLIRADIAARADDAAESFDTKGEQLS